MFLPFSFCYLLLKIFINQFINSNTSENMTLFDTNESDNSLCRDLLIDWLIDLNGISTLLGLSYG